MSAPHREEYPPQCRYHGPIEEAIHWLKGLGKWVLALVGVSAGTLLLTFGAVVKFGLDMTLANKEMQTQIVMLTKDVLELKEADKRICSDLKDLRQKSRPASGLRVEPGE